MPQNLLSHLKNNFNKISDEAALKFIEKKKVKTHTWKQIIAQALALSCWLQKKGLTPNDTVAIYSNTCPEWLAFELACLQLKLVTVPIYPTVSSEDITSIISEISPKLTVVQNKSLYSRYVKLFPEHKEQIIAFQPAPCPNFSEIVLTKPSGSSFFSEVNKIDNNQLATIIYTSGTSGKPKGVKLTHNQVLACIHNVFKQFNVKEGDSTLTFLPFSHVLGRLELWGSIYHNFTLGISRGIEYLKKDIQLIKPTVMVGVPRVFEKIYFGILGQAELWPLQKKLFQNALALGQKIYLEIEEDKPHSFIDLVQWGLYKKTVFSKVKSRLGGRLRFAVSGGAPLDKKVAQFFDFCGIPLFEGYGLTETTGPICVNTPFNYRFGSVGKPIDNITLRFAEDGEILIKGDSVTSGYFAQPKLTKDAFNESGFFKTGDIGKLDSEGYLFITDRKKDLIKTSGGKFIAPQKLQLLLQRDRLISHALIYGDQKKYAVALITVDPVEFMKYKKTNGINEQFKPTEIPTLRPHIQKIIAETNNQLAPFETIKNFAVIDTDFTVESGELTSSLKIKRKVCSHKYKKTLDSLY